MGLFGVGNTVFAFSHALNVRVRHDTLAVRKIRSGLTLGSGYLGRRDNPPSSDILIFLRCLCRCFNTTWMGRRRQQASTVVTVSNHGFWKGQGLNHIPISGDSAVQGH
ncbi:uncharacterized protein LOC117648286 [Thrips palmi]|uniref:Uncharacterized protein LOC117648286 n=1 Tax=Thrips palmi TaxID=161013 RepID=A0A6P8ZCQ1_THRPL|nr:uncharacterized protein LOC117648286 [Thrips palmi]